MRQRLALLAPSVQEDTPPYGRSHMVIRHAIEEPQCYMFRCRVPYAYFLHVENHPIPCMLLKRAATPPESLSTWPSGQRYLDHMLDQLNSHGQLRLSVQVPLRCLDGLFGETWNFRSLRMKFNLKSHEASQAFIGTTGMVGLGEDRSTFQRGLHHGVWSPGAGAKIASLHPRKRSWEPENLESLQPEWFWVGGMCTPWKLRWNPRMKVWSIIFFFKQVICRFHLSFPGCIDCW